MNSIVEINDLLFYWKKKESFFLNIKKLSIENNEKVIMFGESGSGKSTLLNIICGILEPNVGEVRINNTIINKLSQREKDKFRANNIGVIFQQFNIINYLSPLTNILLPCIFTNFKKYNYNYFYERALSLAKSLNLEKELLLQKDSKNLSVGQKQRIAILRSFVNRPKLIVADEPTSALDNSNKKKFINLLLNICKNEKISLLLVSHDTSLKKYFDTNIKIEKINKKNENTD